MSRRGDLQTEADHITALGGRRCGRT